jgi:RHS repeat-associated protein
VTTTYGYDTLSRLLNVTHKKGTTTLDGATYTVDSAGNRLSRTPLPSGTASSYGYDAIYELTGVTQGHSTTESYTYDAVGNRLSAFHSSGWTYNSSNELTSRPSFTYTYDNDGNTLTKVSGSSTTTYAWDFENRSTSVTLPGSGGTVSFKYDPFGRRIYKSSSAGTSVYAYDGDKLVEETNASGGVAARYSQAQRIDEPLAMLRSGATSYYHADGLGSVTSLSSAAGSIANTYTYDSFGNLTASTGSLTNPFRYTARESDTETGLYYYRARYYDPGTGRFLKEDPIRFQGGTNFYPYVSNNPAFSKDPYGLAECPSDCKTLSLNNATTFWDDSFATPEQVDAFFQSTNAPASWDGYDAAAAFIAQGINPGLAVGIVGGETSFGNNGLSSRNTRDPFSSGGSNFAGSLSRSVGTVVKLENHTYTDDTPVTALFNGMNDLPSNIPGSGQVYSTTDGDKYPGFIDYWFRQLAKFLGKCK